jgi:thiol-disulfide isomerase/thioredoxin
LPEPTAPAAEAEPGGGKAGAEPGSTLPDPAPDPGASATNSGEPTARRTSLRPAANPQAVAIQGSSPFESARDTYNPFADAFVKPAGTTVGAEASPSITTTPAPAASQRPKWGDLVAQNPALAALPPAASPRNDAARSLAATDPAGTKNVAAATNPRTPPSAPDRVRLASKPVDGGKAYCRYDARRRQLIDFRVPDLEGRPVRFQDLKSDYVLIDFWGTWCGPCVSSIKHLIEIQKQLGPERLTVVGVAYEEGPREEQVAAVSELAKKMGINYTLALGGLDGPCPLSAAFNVQAYPTMVLVDRYGRILWRDQGAAPATLARLDRVLESAARGDFVRR